MSANLVIDSRENKIIPYIKRSFIKRSLGTSDFVIELLNENICKLIAMIERKTWKDLSASLTDGRYDDQKKRLISAAKITNVYFLIEGYKSSKLRNYKALKTILRRATLRGINVVYTTNIKETAEWLESFCGDIEELNRRGELFTPFDNHLSWAKSQTKPLIDLINPAIGGVDGNHTVVAAKPAENNKAAVWRTIKGVGADTAFALQNVDIKKINNDNIIDLITKCKTPSGKKIGLNRATKIVSKFRESNLLFLSAIKGISIKTAELINDKYLFNDFIKLSAADIANIIKPNGRRIGPVIGKKIYNVIN